MTRSPPPSAPASDPGSGPRQSNLGPRTSITVNAWAMLITIGSVLTFAISMTWAAAGKMADLETRQMLDRGRLDGLEKQVVTREDLHQANAQALAAMRRMLGAAVIRCDQFGGDSKCTILFPAGAGQ